MSPRVRGAPSPSSPSRFSLLSPANYAPRDVSAVVFITAFKLNSFSARPVRLARAKQFPRSGAQLGESGTETGLRNDCRYLAAYINWRIIQDNTTGEMYGACFDNFC